jgi:nucleotide-binding universal stress UspA family protein
MIRDLLLAYDSSPSSKRALLYAVDVAQRTGATIHVAYVKEIPLGPFVKGDPSPVAGEEKVLDDLRGELDEACRATLDAHALDLPDDALRFHVRRSGAVAPSLVSLAEETEADLLVMGTQGHRGLRQAFVGSAAREVLRTAPCPVWTARALDESTEEPTVERVVAPVDFSEPSEAALRYAGRIASLYEAPIKLVHVVEPRNVPSVYELESPKVSTRTIKARAEQALEEWGAEVQADAKDVSYVVRQGDPASIILETAPARTDLLVMATRGLSGVRRTMLGSVTEEVVCEAEGPVLAGRVFPADE